MADQLLEEGVKAPAFTLKDQAGNAVKLSDFKGKKVALYFYPKDFTPGCTAQACSLQAGTKKLKDNGIVVLGVSPDEATRHGEFAEKYALQFPLLADPNKKVHEKYGTWGEKNLYGKKSMGVKRTTFLINAAGKIIKVIKRPNTKDHANEIVKKFAAAE